jgi:hypothetical protein
MGKAGDVGSLKPASTSSSSTGKAGGSKGRGGIHTKGKTGNIPKGKGEWERHYSEQQDCHYWWNSQTDASVWEKLPAPSHALPGLHGSPGKTNPSVPVGTRLVTPYGSGTVTRHKTGTDGTRYVDVKLSAGYVNITEEKARGLRKEETLS